MKIANRVFNIIMAIFLISWLSGCGSNYRIMEEKEVVYNYDSMIGQNFNKIRYYKIYENIGELNDVMYMQSSKRKINPAYSEDCHVIWHVNKTTNIIVGWNIKANIGHCRFMTYILPPLQ